MKKIVFTCKVLIAVVCVAIVTFNFYTSTMPHYMLTSLLFLLLSLSMFLTAYEHKLKKKESKMHFWLFIITGIISLIVAFNTVWTFS